MESLAQDKMPITNILQRDYTEWLYAKILDIRFQMIVIQDNLHEDKDFTIGERELSDITILADKLRAKLKTVKI